MRLRASSRFGSLMTLAALTAVATTTANAQAGRPTSQQRIPVQKESAGDVARKDSAARADSIAAAEAARRDSIGRAEAAARQDSITKADMARRDSVARADSIAAATAAAAAAAARRDSIAREDSIRNAALAAQAALARKGFFFGLAGGYSSPSADYADAFKSGWNVTLPFGWQRRSSRWGIRGDIAYDAHSGKSFQQDAPPPVIPAPVNGGTQVTSNFDVDNGNVWSGNVDGIVDLAKWGADRLSSFYLIGGGGVHIFNKKNVTVTPLEPSQGTGTPLPVTTYESESQTKFGLNGGAGLAFALGRSSLFLESRYFTAYTDNTNSDWIPIILGVKWR
jgi:opacity protein-like surface antigen